MQVFFSPFFLFVCPEVETFILRTDPPLMLECGRSNIEEGISSGSKAAYLEVKDQTCFKANDFLRPNTI